jgi:hypothetical protein
LHGKAYEEKVIAGEPRHSRGGHLFLEGKVIH